MDSGLARLESCLDTAEIRATLDEIRPSESPWSVWVPSADGFACLFGNEGGASGVAEPILAERLTAWWSAADESDEGDLLPLRFRDETYAALWVGNDEDLAWWRDVARVLGAGLVKAQLYESASRESASSGTKLDALNEAGELVRHVDLQVLLTKLMELSIRIMHAQVGAIVLLRDGELTTGIEWGLREEFLFALRSPDGEPFLRRHVERGEPILIADASSSQELDVSKLDVDLRSLLAVPLIAQQRPLGAIVIVNSGDGSLDAQDADVLATIANMAATAVENAVLYEQTREHERIAHEMNLASQIQRSLLPKSFPETPALETAGWCMSASETGGDFFDFLDMGPGRTGIVIGDATGHGMGAALIVFIARSTLKALLDGESDLEKVVTRMNDLVERDFDDDRFMTFFFGVFDDATRELVFTSAGHDPPIIYRPRTDEFIERIATGTPLGILPGMDFPTERIQLEPGDFLALGTDGIWEAQDAERHFYGKDRLKASMRECHGLPVGEAAERIREDILAFHGGAEQNDDITAVFCRIR